MKSLGKFPDPFIAEIAGQPDALRRAASGLAVQRGALLAAAEAARGRTPVLTGMGSSYDACYPASIRLAAAGIPTLMLGAAELLHFRRGMLGASTLVVAVSQSGESAEVVRLAETLLRTPDRPPLVAVTNGGANALAALADVALDTRAGPETGPSTMTFAGSLVVLAALAGLLAGDDLRAVVDRVARQAERTALAIERLLAHEALPDLLVERLGDRASLVVLGRGPARAAAEMAALTLKEATGLAVESLETAQFRHGPLELAGPDLAAIVVATEPETAGLDRALACDLAAVGTAVLLVTAGGGGVEGCLRVDVGDLRAPLAPAASVVPVQLLAWRLAAARGRRPGAYERATKVTTVE